MAVDIMWDRLAQPNAVGNLLSGYEAGQAKGKERKIGNALGQYATDPDAAVKGLMEAGDIQGANALRTFGRQDAQDKARAQVAPMIEAGDYAGAAQGVAGVDPEMAQQLMAWAKTAKAEEKAALQAKMEATAKALLPLKDLPPEQAAARWLQIAPTLGAKPEDIDFTQPGVIEAHINEALEVKDIIAQQKDARDFAATQADREADNRRADAQLRVSQGQLGVSRGNLGQRQREHEERRRQGGYAGAGAAGAWEEF